MARLLRIEYPGAYSGTNPGLWGYDSSRFSQPGNRNYSYQGIGVLVDVRTVKKLGLAQ
jgi:hypothetical protein